MAIGRSSGWSVIGTSILLGRSNDGAYFNEFQIRLYENECQEIVSDGYLFYRNLGEVIEGATPMPF